MSQVVRKPLGSPSPPSLTLGVEGGGLRRCPGVTGHLDLVRAALFREFFLRPVPPRTPRAGSRGRLYVEKSPSTSLTRLCRAPSGGWGGKGEHGVNASLVTLVSVLV